MIDALLRLKRLLLLKRKNRSRTAKTVSIDPKRLCCCCRLFQVVVLSQAKEEQMLLKTYVKAVKNDDSK